MVFQSASGTVTSFAYSYDSDNQRVGLAVAGSALPASSQTFSYDAIGQLAGSKQGTATTTYTATSAAQN